MRDKPAITPDGCYTISKPESDSEPCKELALLARAEMRVTDRLRGCRTTVT